MKAENIDTRTKPLINVDVLCLLLKFVIQRMKYPQVIYVIITWFCFFVTVYWQNCINVVLYFCWLLDAACIRITHTEKFSFIGTVSSFSHVSLNWYVIWQIYTVLQNASVEQFQLSSAMILFWSQLKKWRLFCPVYHPFSPHLSTWSWWKNMYRWRFGAHHVIGTSNDWRLRCHSPRVSQTSGIKSTCLTDWSLPLDDMGKNWRQAKIIAIEKLTKIYIIDLLTGLNR